MPEYRSNAFIIHNGSVVRPDGTLTLEEEQAERLGDKVTLIEESNQDAGEQEQTESLQDKTIKELKEIAKEKGLEGYSKLDKEQLIEAIEKE